MAQPKVALVHDHLVQDGGAERLLRSLMRLYPDAPVYTAFYDSDRMGPDFRGKDIRTSYLDRIPLLRRYYKWGLLFLDGAFRRFDLSGYDLVISSASGWAKSVRTGPRTLHVCYCHTPTRYLWSSADSYIAETGYPTPLKWLFRRLLGRFRRKDRRAADGVDAFVANSHYVARRIKRYYGRDARVIHPPVETGRFAPARRRGDYYLVASRLVPYKRVDLAIAAANRLKRPLKVMGDGVDRKRLEALAGPTVEFLGRVSDAERQRLFGAARALINPQEEDFGITTVEALAAGTPVIAYDRGGAPEILAGGPYGVTFRPQTAAALAGAMRRLDHRQIRPGRLIRRAAEFSEPRFRRELRTYLAALLAGRQASG